MLLCKALLCFLYQQQEIPNILMASPLIINLNTHQVFCSQTLIALSKTEFHLLEILARSSGTVIEHSLLEKELWPDEENIDDPERFKTVIKSLRGKLGSAKGCIVNVRGRGYKFVPETEQCC